MVLLGFWGERTMPSIGWIVWGPICIVAIALAMSRKSWSADRVQPIVQMPWGPFHKGYERGDKGMMGDLDVFGGFLSSN